jgi:hypothetical protein
MRPPRIIKRKKQQSKHKKPKPKPNKKHYLELLFGEAVVVSTPQFVEHRGGVHAEALVLQRLRRLQVEVGCACAEKSSGGSNV